jgi:CheY-like chemotaxis protein
MSQGQEMASATIAERRSGWAIAVVLAILVTAGVTAYRSLAMTSEANRWRDHTREVLTAFANLFGELLEAESLNRGYLITGQESYFQAYEQARALIPGSMTTLRRLTADNPNQQAHLDALAPLFDMRLLVIEKGVELRRSKGFAEAQAWVNAGEGKRIDDQIKALIARCTDEEQHLLALREAQAAADERTSMILVVGGNAVALVVVAVTAFLMLRSAKTLRISLKTVREQEWLQSGLAGLAAQLREERPLADLGHAILSRLSGLLGTPVGALYRHAEAGGLEFTAGLALGAPRQPTVPEGDGLLGEALRSRHMLHLSEIPEGYLPVCSALGTAAPRHLLVLPLIYRDHVEGALELAAFSAPTAIQLTFLERAGESIAVALASARALVQIRALLTTSQQQEEELRVQQEELTQTNEELAEQARQLAERNQQVEAANQSIEAARGDLERQAQQLALTSKYKSEFLSNMSHELRTPLNSLLILSQQLFENPAGNLDEKQVLYARTINSSGQDLLVLINDILDLAKIESGTVTLDVGEVRFGEMHEVLERTMRPLAEQKGLEFSLRLGSGLPQFLRSDAKRVQQVLKNLLSNAIKFTPSTPERRGRVSLSIDLVASGWSEGHPRLSRAGTVVAFAVSDTGIGIPADKQQLIFEAFQQADGGVTRKYGGTGLGLSISRELALLLGGELRVVSTVGSGSTFTLYLPLRLDDSGTVLPSTAVPPPSVLPSTVVAHRPPPPARSPAAGDDGPPPSLIEDDQAGLVAGDRVVLIVEDDVAFARILVELAREHGFKAVVSLRGSAVPGLARNLKPDAITLDIHLTDTNGWHLLDRLKHDPETRHIPVHIITVDDERGRALSQGAHGVLGKPASREALGRAFAELGVFSARKSRRLLVVEDDPVQRAAIVETVGNGDVLTTSVADGEAALAALAAEHFDCIVLDLGLPGMSGQRLLEALHANAQWRSIPVIIYTARDLSPTDEQQLRRSAQTIVLKTAASLDRLLDETALFLHRVHSRLPEAKRKRIERVHQSDNALAGRTVLVADDDVRNVFALASLLERYGLVVLSAENGREALARLEAAPEVSLVLMDIMMPEMDGYAAMRAIRARPQWQQLPIIALTAKAMKGDREQCLAAGASDYITKPVDSDQLLSMLRVWLYR